MRFIKTILHENLSIQLYNWNQKYILKYESGLLEQTYKIPEFDIAGQQAVEELAINPIFIQQIEKRFTEMWKDLAFVLE
ncbi:MAG: hypothetical protein EAZ85_06455 [Bacteroidetes bacterium]|nr:MAG: hypothetical protein EAZ85_06455 [Bacteroidota bacterium]TAG88089.1 MAG: hypothetical protein EAZ20_09305 [Bacteroidota bacterium]